MSSNVHCGEKQAKGESDIERERQGRLNHLKAPGLKELWAFIDPPIPTNLSPACMYPVAFTNHVEPPGVLCFSYFILESAPVTIIST